MCFAGIGSLFWKAHADGAKKFRTCVGFMDFGQHTDFNGSLQDFTLRILARALQAPVDPMKGIFLAFVRKIRPAATIPHTHPKLAWTRRTCDLADEVQRA